MREKKDTCNNKEAERKGKMEGGGSKHERE